MAIFRVIAGLILAFGGLVAIGPLFGLTLFRQKHALEMLSTLGWPFYLFVSAVAATLLAAAWQLIRGKGRVLPLVVAMFKLPSAFWSLYTAPLAIPFLYLLAEATSPWWRKVASPAHWTGLRTFRLASACIFAVYGLTPIVAMPFLIGKIREAAQEKLQREIGFEFYATFAVFSIIFCTAAYQMWRGKGRGFSWFAAVVIAPFALMGGIGLVFAVPVLSLAAEALAPKFAKQPLDAETVQASKTSRGQMIEWLVTIPVVIGVGYLFRHMPGVITPKNAESSFLIFAAYTWVIIAIHELGHALVGKWMGFEWMAFMVTPLEVQRIGGKTHFKFNPTLGGHYCGFPRSAENLWKRHLLMVAGGPAVNIATFLILWAVLVFAQGRIDGYAFGFLRGMMNWSLVTGLINLLPVNLGNFKTDGRHIWDAFFAPAESRKAMAVYGCMVSRNSTLRPRDWQPEWVSALRDGEQDVATAALLSAWATDRLLADPADFEALDTLVRTTEDLDRIAGTLPEQMASSIRFHVDWLRCRYDGIIEERVAKTMAAARKDKATDLYELLRMEAALKAASGETAAAEALFDQAEKDLVRRESGFRLSDLDDLRAFRSVALSNI